MKTSFSLLLSGHSEVVTLRCIALILSFLIGGVMGICAVAIALLLMDLSKKFVSNDIFLFGGIVVVVFILAYSQSMKDCCCKLQVSHVLIHK